MTLKKSKNWSDCSLSPVKLIHSQHQRTANSRRLGGKGPSKSLCLTAPFTVKDRGGNTDRGHITEGDKAKTGTYLSDSQPFFSKHVVRNPPRPMWDPPILNWMMRFWGQLWWCTCPSPTEHKPRPLHGPRRATWTHHLPPRPYVCAGCGPGERWRSWRSCHTGGTTQREVVGSAGLAHLSQPGILPLSKLSFLGPLGLLHI